MEKKASEPSPGKDEDYSFYSGSSRSSSQRRSPSASSADEKPLSGRQWGLDFLPDISVQLEVKTEAKEPPDEAPSKAPGGDLREHVQEEQVGASSLREEYDQTLQRLGAKCAPAHLQRQVTD